MTTISKLRDKLRDHEYRKAFVASQINIGIPFQLRALLKAHGKTQEWLAEKAGMLQPRISGLLTPGKTRPNIDTLRRLAEAFDCGLMIRFVPFSELARWSEGFDPESFDAPSFDDDLGFVERKSADQASAPDALTAWYLKLHEEPTAKPVGTNIISIDQYRNQNTTQNIPHYAQQSIAARWDAKSDAKSIDQRVENVG